MTDPQQPTGSLEVKGTREHLQGTSTLEREPTVEQTLSAASTEILIIHLILQFRALQGQGSYRTVLLSSITLLADAHLAVWLFTGQARPLAQYLPFISKSEKIMQVALGLFNEFHPNIIPSSCEYNGKHLVIFLCLSAGDAYQQYQLFTHSQSLAHCSY